MLSKAVKMGDKLQWWEYVLYYPPVSWAYFPVRRIYRKLARSWAYARFGWSNYDFDSGYVFDLLVFKLERLQRAMLDDGHTVHDKATVQSLRLVTRLLKRLNDNGYSYFYDRHNAKWNPTKIGMSFEPIPNSKLLSMVTFRDALPEDQKQQEEEEVRQAFAADDAMRDRDARWCFNIMAKYYPHWWD